VSELSSFCIFLENERRDWGKDFFRVIRKHLIIIPALKTLYPTFKVLISNCFFQLNPTFFLKNINVKGKT